MTNTEGRLFSYPHNMTQEHFNQYRNSIYSVSFYVLFAAFYTLNFIPAFQQIFSGSLTRFLARPFIAVFIIIFAIYYGHKSNKMSESWLSGSLVGIGVAILTFMVVLYSLYFLFFGGM